MHEQRDYDDQQKRGRGRPRREGGRHEESNGRRAGAFRREPESFDERRGESRERRWSPAEDAYRDAFGSGLEPYGDDPWFDRGDFDVDPMRGGRERGGYPESGSYRGPGRYGGYSGERRGFGTEPRGSGQRQPQYGGRGGFEQHYGFGGGTERYGERGDYGDPGFDQGGGYGESGFEPGYGRERFGGGRGCGESFAGKGPKGFRRSDERVLEEVSQALEDDPRIDASNIEVSCNAGEIVLKGTVSDRHTKRRAEECAEQIAGVKDVRNELRVGASGSSGRESTGRSETAGS